MYMRDGSIRWLLRSCVCIVLTLSCCVCRQWILFCINYKHEEGDWEEVISKTSLLPFKNFTGDLSIFYSLLISVTDQRTYLKGPLRCPQKVGEGTPQSPRGQEFLGSKGSLTSLIHTLVCHLCSSASSPFTPHLGSALSLHMQYSYDGGKKT